MNATNARVTPNTATFQLLKHKSEQHVMVRWDISPFELQTRLFASALLKLLIPKCIGEDTNFLPIYFHQIEDGLVILREYELRDAPQVCHHVDPKIIEHQFAQKSTNNLGALICLNALMSYDFKHTTLGIVHSSNTKKPVFTQKLASFWSDYFNKPSAQHGLSYPLNLNVLNTFNRISSQHEAWWRQTGLYSPSQDKLSLTDDNLLVDDAFEMVVRLFLTPVELIQLIAECFFERNMQTQQFMSYVINKFNTFKQHYYSLLTSEQQQAWQLMLREKNMMYYQRYCTDIKAYSLFKFVNPAMLKSAINAIDLQMMRIGLPDDENEARRVSLKAKRRLSFYADAQTSQEGLFRTRKRSLCLSDLSEKDDDSLTSGLTPC